ncbi:MAG: NAD(P)-binding domain-containing protein [Xanthobacteraceae bacterium]
MSSTCEAVVIGAGPYGLSVAAHLRHAGIAARVFGDPMAFWRNNMPRGMLLRSPWRATHLSDPDGALSLDAYASAHGVDASRRLPGETFVAYGEWFQQRAVADLDRRAVQRIDAARDGFRLTLEDGETLDAGRVILATGLRNQEYRPQVFRNLPRGLVSHTSDHPDLSVFRGKRVAVIGRGQSACESAALLAENGAQVEIISRGDIHWLGVSADGHAPLTLGRRLRGAVASPSEVGPFPLSWLVEVPGVVRHMPAALREEFSRRCLKAAASGWLKPRFAGITCNPGRTICAARPLGDRIALDLDVGERVFDRVLLGTGYRIDVARLDILAPQLLDRIIRADGSPLLRPGFESSVPRLHFVGSYAVKSFGPLLRFIAGASYAARAVAGVAGRPARHAPAGRVRADNLFGAVATPHLGPLSD